MSLVWAALIIVVVTTVSVAAMLLVRRGAPEGSRFADGDRAAGVFGVLSTGFAIMLGFVIFLAFESYDTSRSGAETEAEIVLQQFETAQFMPVEVRARLSGELQCYARTVVHVEWPQMESGGLQDVFNPWGVSMFRTMQGWTRSRARSRRPLTSGSTSAPIASPPARTGCTERKA